MNFCAGDAFYFSVEHSHLWIILSDTVMHTEELLCVNLTTLKDTALAKPDESCVILAGEITSISRDSFAYYAGARIFTSLQLELLYKKNLIKLMPAVSDIALLKLREGASKSPYLRGRYKHLI